jgi:hypothetical protein
MFVYIFMSTVDIVIKEKGADNVHFVLDERTSLEYYTASSLKQHSAGRHVAPLGHIILIPS